MKKIDYESTLAGSINNALINANTPSTANPTNLKGSKTNHMKGYRNKSAIAKGQQITNKMSQRSSFMILSFTIPNESRSNLLDKTNTWF